MARHKFYFTIILPNHYHLNYYEQVFIAVILLKLRQRDTVCILQSALHQLLYARDILKKIVS